MEEIHNCFIEGCEKVSGLNTHGYVEKDGTKHWEYLCKEHHTEVHPEFNSRVDERDE